MRAIDLKKGCRISLFLDIQFADVDAVTCHHSSSEQLSTPAPVERTSSKEDKNKAAESNMADASSLSTSQHSLTSTDSRLVHRCLSFLHDELLLCLKMLLLLPIFKVANIDTQS